MDSIRADTGIPEGIRFSIGGSMRIGADAGGSMTIDYETFKLRQGEAFIVYDNSKEVLKVEAGNDDLDDDDMSKRIASTKTIEMKKGDHLIQFSVESRIEPDLISSYWQTKD